jgi:hypothetical protein
MQKGKLMTELEKLILEKGFDHPCKDTCSGWKQGFERGAFELEKLKAENEKQAEKILILREAIADVIRNSFDIIAKKRCSVALAGAEGSIDE